MTSMISDDYSSSRRSSSQQSQILKLSNVKDDPFFLANYYPNECFICCETNVKRETPLKRCSRCKMVTYCSEKHEKSHFFAHQDLCNAIMQTLKQRDWKIVIFERMKEIRQEWWIKERQNLLCAVEYNLRKKLLPCEQGMFLFPRVCFVCHFSKQEMLTDCPGCPGASFCEEHKDSPLHKPFCQMIQKCHELDSMYLQSYMTQKELKNVAREFVINSPIIEWIKKFGTINLQPPTSMEEFFDNFAEPVKCDLPDYKIHVSEHLTKVLTVYNAVQKLRITPHQSELIVYVGGADRSRDGPKFWELLLHLRPDIMNLRIVLMDQDIDLFERINLCEGCLEKGKILFVENIDYGYPKLDEYRDRVRVNLVIFFNYDPPTKKQPWKNPEKLWSNIIAPVALTTINKEKAEIAVERLKEGFGSSDITFRYNGKNNFCSLRPRREWSDFSAYLQNEYMVLYKIKPKINGENKNIPKSSTA